MACLTPPTPPRPRRRLALAEKLRAPWRRNARRPDPATVAAREAHKLEAESGPAAPLDFCVKMMFIGLTGGCAPAAVCSRLLVHALRGYLRPLPCSSSAREWGCMEAAPPLFCDHARKPQLAHLLLSDRVRQP